MRLNKTSQCAMLFALYLTRSGRASTKDIAENLSLSRPFLEQIALKLKRAGVVTSTRGPGGGHELREDATVADVLSAVGNDEVITKEESEWLQTGQVEHRALANFIGATSYHLAHMFSCTIREVSDALVQQEMEQLDTINDNTTVN